MSGVVIQTGFVVNSGGNNLDANSPVIGYENRVTSSNVSATTEDPDFPASNLANPATHLLWKSGQGSPNDAEYITVILDTVEDVDYLAIARHNFGSGTFPVSVEALVDNVSSPTEWTELIPEQLLANDGPVIFRFTAQSLYAIRLRIGTPLTLVDVLPELAVLFVGAALLLQRRIYVGHTPIPYGRELMVVSHRSISGAFLGRIITGQKRKSSISLANLTPSWYRTYMEPFIEATLDGTFFFAWRPGDYPMEVGYVWFVDDPKPSNQRPNGMMQIDMQIEGVV